MSERRQPLAGLGTSPQWLQRTLAGRTQTIHGTGLHSGARSSVILGPAAAGQGLLFQRGDEPGGPDIPAVVERVLPAERCTLLAQGTSRVRTVEHLLAACVFAGVDNAVLTVEGEELPALDGSAAEYLDLIEHVGLITQDVPAPAWRLSGPCVLEDPVGGRWRISAVPAEAPAFVFRFRGGGRLDGREAAWRPGGPGSAGDPATRRVAEARTFCFERDVAALHAAGLGLGGSLDNVLVLREDGSSVNASRGDDEPVRHKLLDLIGDLALAGAPMLATITAEGTGHAVHAEFLRRLRPTLVQQEATQPRA